MVLEGFTVFGGDWWCASCSRTRTDVLSVASLSVPRCPKCGARMEEAGAGDDDPYPDDPNWRDDDR